MSVNPRAHLYCFVHKALPTLGMQDPNAMFAALCMRESSDSLELAWNYTGTKIEQSERTEFPELACTSTRRGDFIIAVIQFPKPMQVTDPHFSAFVFGPIQELETQNTIGIRYFVLEHAESLETGGPKTFTILGEWKNELHLNHGPCFAESREAFEEAVWEKAA